MSPRKQKKSKLSESQILKRKTRARQEWKDLREKKRKEQKVDPISLKPLSRSFNLHHMNLDESKYDDLSDDNNFLGLNDYSHRVIHYLFDIIEREGDFEVINRLMEILNKMYIINCK